MPRGGVSEHPYDEIRRRLKRFVDDRDWSQFHSPKNLATCVTVEAGELLELFLWTREGPGPHPPGAGPPEPARIQDEMADVFISLLNLAAEVGVDLPRAAAHKLEALEHKYPVALARGSAVKNPGGVEPNAVE